MNLRHVVVRMILVAVCASAQAGCATVLTPTRLEEIRLAYENLDLSDGVDPSEAVVIARHYIVYVVGDGKQWPLVLRSADVGESGLREGCWYVSFSAAFDLWDRSGLKGYSVHVDKKTGKVWCHGWWPC